MTGFIPQPTAAQAVENKFAQALRGDYPNMQGLTRREFRRLCLCFNDMYGPEVVNDEVERYIASRDDWESEPNERFWYWCNERHRIYLKKEAGESWPWTDDPILQEYKFTNVYRDLDRVTVELFKRMRDGLTPAQQLFEVGKFRLFNWPPTYDKLPVPWNEEKAKEILHGTKDKIFTGAYIVSNNGRSMSKIDLVCRAVSDLLEKAAPMAEQMQRVNTLEHATEILTKHVLLCGPFVAYEIVSDLRHLFLSSATDTMLWANPGPGAVRGLKRLGKFGDPVYAMRQLLQESQQPAVLGEHMRSMEMRDIEHSLCEFDKYERVRKNEGKPRNKYRQRSAA